MRGVGCRRSVMRTVRREVMPKGDVVKKVGASELTYAEMGPMAVSEYLSTPESKDYEELHYGWLMSEACPATAHQAVAGDMYVALRSYVMEHRLGFVLQHVDVILDEERSLSWVRISWSFSTSAVTSCESRCGERRI
jgi:hypothetical protein